MNTAKITRFLAEAIEWTPANNEEHLWGFDPMNDIAHAWMVEEAIAEMGDVKTHGYANELDIIIAEKHIPRLVFALIHASPEQRCIAAVRVLADEKQLEEMGIK